MSLLCEKILQNLETYEGTNKFTPVTLIKMKNAPAFALNVVLPQLIKANVS